MSGSIAATAVVAAQAATPGSGAGELVVGSDEQPSIHVNVNPSSTGGLEHYA